MLRSVVRFHLAPPSTKLPGQLGCAYARRPARSVQMSGSIRPCGQPHGQPVLRPNMLRSYRQRKRGGRWIVPTPIDASMTAFGDAPARAIGIPEGHIRDHPDNHPGSALISSPDLGVLDVDDEASRLRRGRVTCSSVHDVADVDPLPLSRHFMPRATPAPSSRTCQRRRGPGQAG